MAKDPAFLFYPGDFKMGTLTFSREDKGDYIDLLCALHANEGYMAIEDIKIVCPNISTKVLSKLKINKETGKYFQQRLLDEIMKRKSFSDSRRKNRMSKTSVNTLDVTSEKEVTSLVEDENEIIDSFSLFWNTYNKKRGKEKTLELWQRLTPEERKACISAVPKYVAANEVKFRKDPERYLKYRAWEDDVIGETVKTKNGELTLTSHPNTILTAIELAIGRNDKEAAKQIIYKFHKQVFSILPAKDIERLALMPKAAISQEMIKELVFKYFTIDG